MKRITIFVVSGLLIAACTSASGPTPEPNPTPPDSPITSPTEGDMNTSEPIENPFSPKPLDGTFERGNVFIQESGLLIRESYPPQISLAISGDLPTPCHQLRVVIGEPDENNKINVDVYTVVDPNMMCTQVLKPFSESIDFGMFPSGHYSVWVNGGPVGEFDS